MRISETHTPSTHPPFPATTEEQKTRIRELAEQLDAHRKRQQEQYSNLTMTDMYNVLEKLRSGEALTAKDKIIHEQGLVSVLKQLHDDLDKTVFAAYGWADLPLGTPSSSSAPLDQIILERLVALNADRAAEEAQGKICWLRPDFQNPTGTHTEQTTIALGDETTDDRPQTADQAQSTKNQELSLWPKSLPDQVRALREILTANPAPATAATLARHFTNARKDRVEELLQTLVALGQAREVEPGTFVG